MKGVRSLIVVLGVALIAAPAFADTSRELVDPSEVQVAAPAPAPGTWRAPEAVLYDNGPLVTHPGGGAGGADASALQTNLVMNTIGFGHQFSTGNRMADDFTVTSATGWQIDTITFFAYQTGSTTTSTITGIYLQIWNGDPSAGGSVVWGDLTTNRMASTAWTNIYRVTDTTLTTGTTRPIMATAATVGVELPAGTYWLDWMTDGSLASGPWAPPVSILGQTTTGNALQYTSGAWAAAVDSGTLTGQGIPFIIDGSIPGQPTATPDPNLGFPVPTLNRWGVVAMLVLLAGAAILLITRRS